MKIAVRLLIIVFVAVAAMWLWGVLFPSPDRLIRKRLAGIAAAASFAHGQSYILRLAEAQRLADSFATNAEINIDLPGRQARQFSGRDDVLQAALSARATLDSLKVTFPDVVLTIEPDKKSAIADLTAEARISGDSDLYVQEMKFAFRKFDGQWLIIRVETVQTLQNAVRQ